VRQESLAPISFIGSRFFLYFVLSSGFGLLLLALLFIGEPRRQSPQAEEGGLFARLASRFAGLISRLQKPKVVADEVSMDHEEFPATSSDVKTTVSDFGDFLDRIVAEESTRLQKVGISIKTQVEEGAKVSCSPQRVADFLKRLIGNSVLALQDEENKEIQIQMVQQQDSYQLIYVDTRSDHFPSQRPSSLMAQTEASLQGIDGIIAYAGWLFADGLTVAKEGFCLSIDLPKVDLETAITPQTIPLQETLERIEIDDADTDVDLISGFSAIEPAKKEEPSHDESAEPSVNFDDVIEQFRMKDFSFQASSTPQEEVEPILEVPPPQEEPDTEPLQPDDKGLFEFNSGQFKIKIRSPKKREDDVSR
jgi:hypothetical protein